MKWVSAPTLDELKANALVKYSPIKQLTEQQSQLINEILSHDKKTTLLTEMMELEKLSYLPILSLNSYNLTKTKILQS